LCFSAFTLLCRFFRFFGFLFLRVQLKEKYLNKKQTNSNRCKNECHSNPYPAGNGRLAYLLQIIPQSDTNENDGDGNENDSD
jgi:hypothetical protein